MSNSLQHKINLGRQALKQGQFETAGALFEEAACQKEDAHEAWAGLAEVAQGIGQLDTALQFLEHAVALRPEMARYWQSLGELHGRAGDPQKSLQVLEEACRRFPHEVNLMCSLSGAYVKANNWGKAKGILGRLFSQRGFKPEAAHYCLLGMAFQETGELDQAIGTFKKATVKDPRYPDAWLALGHLYLQKNQQEELGQSVKKLSALAPDNPMTQELAGELALNQENFKEAANFFRHALEKAADSASLRASASLQAKLGFALAQTEDSVGAIDALTKAHEMGVDEGWIFDQLGMMFARRYQLDAAKENLEMAVERDPDNLTAWNGLMVVYSRTGEAQKATRIADKILEKNPNYLSTILNMGSLCADQARNEEALAYYRRALKVNPRSSVAYANSLWALVHSSEAGFADILEVAKEFDSHLCRPLFRQDSFADRDKDKERRLKIGWLTSDMRQHPVAEFVLPFLGLLDRQKTENFVYFNSMNSDRMTQIAKERADHWREVIGLGDERLAELIRADEIDILVDLNGNTQGSRLLAVARKPAPIQVSWLGFPGTSGMTAVDYIFIPPDPVLEKGGWCTEIPWALPDCYGVRSVISKVPVLPGLPCERLSRPFTFACLNNFRKVSQKAVELWSQILLKVPQSRLVLIARAGRDETMIRHIEEQFGQYGISPERLDIRGFVPAKTYFESYNEMDLCLDPFPFNGGTTGYDSIWMGVPFVTWPGETLVSRMGRIILLNVGLSELVAKSAEDYVEIAVALAHDRERLKNLRTNLRERMAASPLVDAPRMARVLEGAFREMWGRWLEKDAATFELPSLKGGNS